MKAKMPLILTAKERKALKDEIDKQLAENVSKMSCNLQALVLWELHEQLGFGKKRLLRFQERFQPMIEELQRFYEIRTADDTDFVCKYKLKNEVGIDVDELEAMFRFQIVDNQADKKKE